MPQKLNRNDLPNYIVKVFDPENPKNFGTGFFFHRNGYILTCHHVICFMKTIQVEYGTKSYIAEWCEQLSLPDLDVAILRVSINERFEIFELEMNDLDESNLPIDVWIFGFSQDTLESYPRGKLHTAKLTEEDPISPLSTYRNEAQTVIDCKQPWNIIASSNKVAFLAYQLDQGTKSGIKAGISGSPVISTSSTSSKKVVGILQSSSDNSSIAVRISNPQLIGVLRSLVPDISEAYLNLIRDKLIRVLAVNLPENLQEEETTTFINSCLPEKNLDIAELKIIGEKFLQLTWKENKKIQKIIFTLEIINDDY